MTASDQQSDTDRIREKYERVFQEVPEIGTGHRWYDYLYRPLRWLASGWRKTLLPKPLKRFCQKQINWLLPYNELDQDKATPLDDPFDNMIVKEGEHIENPGLWVVELFPPSCYESLKKAIETHGWDYREANEMDASRIVV